MRARRGFTLVEATIASGILMVGVISLIHIARTSAGQIREIRWKQGQPAIAERLLHDQIEAILAPGSAPGSPQVVPPLGQCAGSEGGDCITYAVTPARVPGCDVGGLACYEISVGLQGNAFTAADNVAPPVRIWRLP